MKSKWMLVYSGNVGDIRRSLKRVWNHITVTELREEIGLEERFRNRPTVIKMLQAAIRRKEKEMKPQELKPQVMEEKRYCPSCATETIQAPAFLDPDDPEAGEAWCCSVCLEMIDIIPEKK